MVRGRCSLSHSLRLRAPLPLRSTNRKPPRHGGGAHFKVPQSHRRASASQRRKRRTQSRFIGTPLQLGHVLAATIESDHWPEVLSAGARTHTPKTPTTASPSAAHYRPDARTVVRKLRPSVCGGRDSEAPKRPRADSFRSVRVCHEGPAAVARGNRSSQPLPCYYLLNIRHVRAKSLPSTGTRCAGPPDAGSPSRKAGPGIIAQHVLICREAALLSRSLLFEQQAISGSARASLAGILHAIPSLR